MDVWSLNLIVMVIPSVSVQDSSMASSGERMQLHFIGCIVLDDEKSDALIVVSCLEAGLQALHHRFPHLRQVIFQSVRKISLER